mgnify:CR=1 FL=1
MARATNRPTHGGTLDGILEKLDYLLELGITAIWVTPIYENIDRFFEAEPYHYYWPQRFDRIGEPVTQGEGFDRGKRTHFAGVAEFDRQG